MLGIKMTEDVLHTMQINIPESKYGSCSYLLPRVIVDWFGARGIKYPSYCGNNSSGTGYTDGGI